MSQAEHVGEAMGLAQHHDAVSGTEKQHVADDYAERLSDGIGRAMVCPFETKLACEFSRLGFSSECDQCCL